ncbi:hypothetical protein [Caldimonas brevitalea]|nr:hypothetical protein [Caldimonas brevitalea]
MFNSDWRYFGRTSGMADIYEIFRCPADKKKLGLTDIPLMERLRSDGTWFQDPTDRALMDEMFSGWFSESDEISPEKARELFERWKTIDDWPGRE